MEEIISTLLYSYADTFHECFPLFMVNFNADELIRVLSECLENGTPYQFDEVTKQMIHDPNILF